MLPFSPHSALFPSPHPFYLLCFSNNWPFFTILHEPFQFLVVVCCQLFSTATSPCQVQCPRNHTSDRPSTQLCRNTRTYPLVSISLSSNVFARPRPPPQHHTMLIHIARNQNADVPARHVLLHVQPPCPISPLAICDRDVFACCNSNSSALLQRNRLTWFANYYKKRQTSYPSRTTTNRETKKCW